MSKDIERKFSDYPVFTYRDLSLYFRKGRNMARIISYMKNTGKVHTVTKGVYTFNKDDGVSGFAYRPFYYGLLSALTIRELWTQNSRPDIMTMKRVRSSQTSVFGDKNDIVFLHHITAKYFFGFDLIKHGRFVVPVSDPEKTLIDLIYYKTTLAMKDYDGLLNAVDRRKLGVYLKRYDRRTADKVMGFVGKYRRIAVSGKLRSPY